MADTLQPEYDLVIVGSGGGSMPAALVAKSLGKSAVILEKLDVIGGSTSYSGGVWWIPNNPLLAEAGIKDSFEQARDYFDAVVTHAGPGVTPARRDAFLKAGPRMIRFLMDLGLKLRRPTDDWPDYYDDAPGGLAAGRSLMPAPFNMHELGEWETRLAMYPPMAMLPMGPDEFPTMFLMKRTFAGKMKALKMGMLMARDRVLKRWSVSNGAAIQGRMLQIALREGIQIHRDVPVTGLVEENGRVTGVTIERNGVSTKVRARDGVIVNAGGFSRNKAMREKYYAGAPTTDEWTNANAGDTGEMIEAMIGLGAATDDLDTAWWLVTTRNIDGSWPEGAIGADGRPLPFMHHLDLSLPFSILVDRAGRRFADEAGAYMEIGERMYARHREAGSCFPAWVIFDKRQRERYPWGSAMPGQIPQQWLDSGYLKQADTLDELARMCGIDSAGLIAEVARFNGFCATGVDLDYGRGSRAFDRSHGDPTVKPNPNLGPIEQGPFYAAAAFPGDVGTAGGVVADEYARVLRSNGEIIPGLYAIGNSTASVFGHCYPGAGASIGASFTFGFVAAHHALGSDKIAEILA